MVKGTPKEWVDKLLRDPEHWVPPIPRYVGESPASFEGWESYRELMAHHQQEMDLLYAVIRELVRRVKSDV